jgi:ABC-type branched-subunit amino acid transport system substrate-binding protein
MFEPRRDRGKLVLLVSALVLAGCKVIPTAPVTTPTPAPGDGLPTDQQRHRIALLVPLSGPNAAQGQSVANATTMALLDTESRAIRITTYDTATGPADAARKALQDGNRLILGPIQGDDIATITQIVRPARVPMITYNNDAALASNDVLVMATLPADAIQRVVTYASTHGAKRFALLYPTGDYGARAKAAFVQSVVASGGSLVASESYERSNTSIISAARRIKARGGYDTILIADSARFAAMAAPQLKAAAASPRILGTELWNGEAAITGTPALRGAWFAAVSEARFRQFADSYKARFNAPPYRLATMGYDSVLLAVRIARDWKVGTPFPLARLTDRGGFLGLDGPFRFAAGGIGERALEVREVRAKGVGVIDPAPARFVD